MPKNDELMFGGGRSAAAMEFAAWIVLAAAIGLLIITAWVGAKQLANCQMEQARNSVVEGRR